MKNATYIFDIFPLGREEEDSPKTMNNNILILIHNFKFLDFLHDFKRFVYFFGIVENKNHFVLRYNKMIYVPKNGFGSSFLFQIERYTILENQIFQFSSPLCNDESRIKFSLHLFFLRKFKFHIILYTFS